MLPFRSLLVVSIGGGILTVAHKATPAGGPHEAHLLPQPQAQTTSNCQALFLVLRFASASGPLHMLLSPRNTPPTHTQEPPCHGWLHPSPAHPSPLQKATIYIKLLYLPSETLFPIFYIIHFTVLINV